VAARLRWHIDNLAFGGFDLVDSQIAQIGLSAVEAFANDLVRLRQAFGVVTSASFLG
jgi:hypothetical protein